jgi:Zn ribbon nucleic-acid-binding protein
MVLFKIAFIIPGSKSWYSHGAHPTINHFGELQDHLVKTHHFCPQCNVYYDSVEQLQEHDVTRHHLCVKCGDYFANKNNLEMVVHRLVLKSLNRFFSVKRNINLESWNATVVTKTLSYFPEC